MGDTEVGVELVDLAHQQPDAMLRTQQSLAGANDADVVPHEAAQFVPIVRNDDFLVGIGDRLSSQGQDRATDGPAGPAMSATAASANTRHSSKGVRGQSVGTMQTGAGCPSPAA